jgi:dienelactone hydrolase
MLVALGDVACKPERWITRTVSLSGLLICDDTSVTKVYGGAMHAFTNPAANVDGMGYHAAADRRSRNAVLALFEEVF